MARNAGRSARIAVASFLLLLRSGPGAAAAEEGTCRFYHGRPYGSEALVHPLTVAVNEGFSILQISNRSNRLVDIDFEQGARNVGHNLCHPLRAIDRYGWERFLRREIVPTGVGLENAQFFPNYMLHLLGGGFTFRMLQEWYGWHGFGRPAWWALATCAAYHFLNETVENDGYAGPNVDPVADLYIFDPLGILLFRSDRVARFFQHTLKLRDWSFMPAFDPRLRTLENVGQNFVLRYDLGFWEPWSLLYHFGMHGMLGLSYRGRAGRSYSLAGGLRAKELVEIDRDHGARTQTTTLVWTAGLFYDLDDSLLASLILSGTKGYRARLNLYPGLVRLGPFSPGLFANLRRDDQIVLGGIVSFLPVGFAGRPHR